VIGMDAGRNAPVQAQCMPLVFVSPGYFEAMGIRVSGRSPTWSNLAGLEGPVVVSEAFARRAWPDENAVGHRVRPFNSLRFPFFPVVGVAADVRYDGLQRPPIEAVYLPLMPAAGSPGWNPPHAMTFVIHAPSVDQRTLTASVRAIVAHMDPTVPIANIRSMEAIVARSMAQTSFTMLLLLISASIALLLSAVGIYGVIAYVVSQRRSEIGIRIALGAQAGQVARMVVEQSVVLACVGAVVGVVAALVATRLLESLLFEVRATDPITLAGTCIVLVVVAIFASLGPARRAAKVDPVEAMRG
jgi:putative ABC transport system permease protein